MCAYNITKDTIRRVNFDSDGIPFVMDNSANCHICTDKTFFTELHLFTTMEKEALGSIGTIGDGAIPEGFGNMRLIWKDDCRVDHEYIINDVFYVPNSPVNLVGVTKFGKQIEPKDKDFPEGTNIQTFTNHSVFTWDRGQFRQTLIHPPCSIPIMFMNNGFQKLEALCTILEKVDNETIHKAFMTEGEIPDESLKGFMVQLRDMVKRQNLSEEMICYYYYHNVLNHISLQCIH